MTEITTDQPAELTDLHPSEILMALIVTLLAPMFLGVTAGDISLARLAALETVNAYQARNQADLIAIAQIIACGLAALGSLSLSMDDDISLSMTLRLRGSAVALNRSAEQNRRVLNQPLRDNPTLYQVEMPSDPETTPAATADDLGIARAEAFLSAAAAQELAAEAAAACKTQGRSPAKPRHRRKTLPSQTSDTRKCGQSPWSRRHRRSPPASCTFRQPNARQLPSERPHSAAPPTNCSPVSVRRAPAPHPCRQEYSPHHNRVRATG